MGLYYTSQEVVRLTGIKYRQLDYWVNLGLVRPSGRNSYKKGVRRFFTFQDMLELRVVNRLLSCGLRLTVIRNCLMVLRKDLAKSGKTSTSVHLVSDGKTVLRYNPEEDSLISLDGYGQVAFAFGFSSEVAELTSAVKSTPNRCRYRKRA